MLPQLCGEFGVDGAAQVAEHNQRLSGLRRRIQHGEPVRLVPVQLVDQVDGKGDRVHRRILGEGDQRVREQAAGVGAGAPHVERVGRGQAGVQEVGQPGLGRRADGGERHPAILGQIGRVRAFQAGVMHGRDAGLGGRAGLPAVATAAGSTAPDREQLQGVGEFSEIADAVHAVGAGQGLPAAVVRGQRAGVRGDQGPPAGRAPGGEQDDRDVPLGAAGEDPAEQARFPDRLEDQGQHLGLGQPQRVVEVGGCRGDEFLAGGHGEAVADRPAGAQHHGKHRAGVRDQGDRANREWIRLRVADRAQPAGHVHEPHAPGTAQLHAGLPGDARQPVTQQPRRLHRFTCLRHRCTDGLVRTSLLVHRRAGGGGFVGVAEDHRRAVAAPGRERELLLQGRVGHREQHQVDRSRQVSERRDAPPPADLGVPGVDQVNLGPGRAPGHLVEHPLPERAGPRRGADERDAARLQHRRQVRAGHAAGWWACAIGAIGPGGARRHGRRRSRVRLTGRGVAFRAVSDGHDRRMILRTWLVRRAAFLSAMAARAACHPGMPHTPPPACVAELP